MLDRLRLGLVGGWLLVATTGTLAITTVTTRTTVRAQELASPTTQSVKPGINDEFLNPELDVDDWVQKFEVESREVFRGRTEIVAAMKLDAGNAVADVGTGTGLFVELLADAVGPSGQVFALDIAPGFVERAGAIAEARDLSNVTPVLAGEDDVRLPTASIDAALVCDVYHHFEYPAASLASLHDAIRPGGSLIVIDFERIEGVTRDWLMNHVRADKRTFTAEIEAAGFELVGEVEIDAFEENYFLRFRRP